MKIFISERQWSNPILSHPKFSYYFLTGLIEDFLVPDVASVFFISLKAYSLKPSQFKERYQQWIETQSSSKVLICLADSSDKSTALQEIILQTLSSEVQLIVTHNIEEVSSHLETYA